jgi:hypothetical protein
MFPFSFKAATANAVIRTDSSYVNVLMKGIDVGILQESDKYYIYLPKYIAFPDSRAERIDFYVKIDSDHTVRATQNLLPSKIMNLAYSANMNNEDEYSILDSVFVDEDDIPTQSQLEYYNNTNIIVSELNNPFYFPVSQSYQGGAAIVQLAVAHEEITSSQVGQFPLYVFTSERIFALGTGSGNVLYGNLTPISAEVCINRNVLQTKYGIVFVARSGLKMISGREVADISDVIERDVDMDVRKQDGMPTPPYMQALNNSALVNLYGKLSAVIFEDYIKDAAFGYDINQNEITVSNKEYDYSYVFELDNRVWHKTGEVFEHFSGNTCLMKLNVSNRRHVADIRFEVGKNAEVLLQTRPMVMSDYDFKAVRRFAVRGEVKLAGGRLFGFYGLGSNNLKDYQMTAGVQAGNYFGVLLTQKAGKWSRYYVLMCAGDISMDSNISHFEVEFTDKINGRLR